MNREYYIYWYRLDGNDGYLIWFSTDDKDGFISNEDGFVLCFENKDDLKKYADKLQIAVNTDAPKLLNLDTVKNWLNDADSKIEDYKLFLDAWNLFDDISISTDGNFDKDKKVTNGLYERIFWGCNISVVTPEGESFTPTWTKKELKIIRETLKYGFQMFNEKVKQY